MNIDRNHNSNTPRGNDDDRGDHTPEPVRGDRLDALLRAWHDEHRESARAKIKVMVKRILNRYGYPPDLQEEAVKTVLMQAELLCADWASVQ